MSDYILKTPVPVSSMGAMIAEAGQHGHDPRDLITHEEHVALYLRSLGFDPRDIAVGLDEAIEIAREELQS